MNTQPALGPSRGPDPSHAPDTSHAPGTSDLETTTAPAATSTGHRLIAIALLLMAALCFVAAGIAVLSPFVRGEIALSVPRLTFTAIAAGVGYAAALFGSWKRLSDPRIRVSLLIAYTSAVGTFAYGALRALADVLAGNEAADDALACGASFTGAIFLALGAVLALGTAAWPTGRSRSTATSPTGRSRGTAAWPERPGHVSTRLRNSHIAGFACLLLAIPLFIAAAASTPACQTGAELPTALVIVASSCAAACAIAGVWFLGVSRVVQTVAIVVYLLGVGLLFSLLPRFRPTTVLDPEAHVLDAHAELSPLGMLQVGAADLLAVLTMVIALGCGVWLTLRTQATSRLVGTQGRTASGPAS